MEWVERAPRHGPALFLSRAGGGGQPVFVDPYGHRVRRLRHGARVVAGVAAAYLALLALGLAGPATPPFSLFPGVGDKAGESGTEAVRTSAGAVGAERTRDASAGGPLLRGGLPSVDGLGPAGPAPGTAPSSDAPTAAPGAPAASAPAPAAPSAAAPGQAPAPSRAAPAPSGRSGPPAGSGPKSSPPSNPGQGYGPPSGHVPPGQAKKTAAGPGNGNGNGPPANHGQEMAAQHSRSPNH